MQFENWQVSPDDIPGIEEVEFEGLEKDYLWARLTAWGIFYFLLLVALMITWFFTDDIGLWVFLVPWIVLAVFTSVAVIRGFRVKGYAIRTRDVSYKSGWIWFNMTSVPFNRIQHSEVSQGPLARLFDLASVKIYTAGGSYSDVTISGLKKEMAQRLRDHITKLSAEHE